MTTLRTVLDTLWKSGDLTPEHLYEMRRHILAMTDPPQTPPNPWDDGAED